jgi:multiple sugar transport system substrate-binding protein
MVSRRNASAAVGVAVAALLLAACGRSGSGGDSKETAAPTLSAGKAKGTITIWAQGQEGTSLPTLTKKFEAANPGVKVKITALPWDAAHAKYQTSIAGGSTPDIAQMGTTWMSDFADAFEPVPSSIDTSDMFPGAKSTTVVKGKTVGVPWYVDTRVIYYRTDIAAKAGYTTAPTTWADFKAMAKAMQTKGGAKWGISLPTGGADSFQSILPFMWSGGASLTSGDNSKWTFDTPAMTDALKYYQSFFTEGIATRNPPTGAGASESTFVSGKTAMLIAGPSEIGSLAAAGGPSFASKYSVMTIPKQASSTSFVGGSDLVVFKNSKNKDAAWKLVKSLSEPANQAAWHTAAGDLPAVQSAWDDPSLSGDKLLSIFRTQLGSTKSPPALTTWTQVSAAADQALEQIVKGNKDPADAMKTLQSNADSIGVGD